MARHVVDEVFEEGVLTQDGLIARDDQLFSSPR